MLLSYKLVYYPKYIINCAPKGPGGCPVLAGGWWGLRWIPALNREILYCSLPNKVLLPCLQFKFSALLLLLNIGLCQRLVSGGWGHPGEAEWHQISRYQPRPDIGVTISAQTCAPLVSPAQHQQDDDDGIFRWTPLYTLTRCSGNIKRGI